MLPGFNCALFGFGGCDCTPAYVTGNRTASITVTASATLYDGGGTPPNLVNGSTAQDASNGIFDSAADAVAGLFIKFAYAVAVKINEAKMYGEAFSHGTWKWQGSDDDSTWEDIGPNFTFTCTVAGTVETSMSGNTKGYRYYRMLGVSGNMTINRWITEFEFQQCTC
jgi:hypothetical protein